MIAWSLTIYLVTGGLAGFLAGLLGVGGGILIVPTLVFLFGQTGFASAAVLPLALGTSLASIVATSIASAKAHQMNGNADLRIAWAAAPWAAAGTLLGPWGLRQ